MASHVSLWLQHVITAHVQVVNAVAVMHLLDGSESIKPDSASKHGSHALCLTQRQPWHLTQLLNAYEQYISDFGRGWDLALCAGRVDKGRCLSH